MSKFNLIMSLILSLLLSCSKKIVSTNTIPSTKTATKLAATDPTVIPIDTNCHISGPIIAQAKDWEGYVQYLGNTKLYSITYTVPNTIDSQWIGYVCNMPDEFKRGGLKVVFSGNYYHAYKYIKHTGIDGHPQFYLSLERIRML